MAVQVTMALLATLARVVATVAVLFVVGCSNDGATSSSATGGASSAPPTAEEGSGGEGELTLTRGDACGEAYFWAATPGGDVAVTVVVDAQDRSTTEPTRLPIDIEDPEVIVRVLHGDDMTRNFCTDVIDPSAEPRSSRPATAGQGEVVLDPRSPALDCGSTSGRLRLDGVVADDGTKFAPIDVSSDGIGCYSG